MSAKEPGPHWLRVEEPRGSETRVDVTDGALVARELEVEFADVVLETSNPANLLCVAITSFFFALVNEFRKLLDEVSDFCCAGIGEHRADHTDDGGGKGAQVVVGPGRTVQQELLGGRSGFGWLGHSLRGVDDFLGGGVEVGISGTIVS